MLTVQLCNQYNYFIPYHVTGSYKVPILCLLASCINMYRLMLRDWSKSIFSGRGGGGGGWVESGPEQRGGGSLVFEPLARGGSFTF